LATQHKETSDRKGWAIAFAAMAAMAISFFDRQTFSVLAPRITSELHISNASYGWLGSAFAWAYLLGSPIAGRIVDRVGARRALVVSIVIWSSVAALHAAASGFVALLVLRAALGLSESPSFPGAVQAMSRSLPKKQVTRGVSLVFVGISVGSLVAAPVATLLAARFGWRMAFVGTAAVALVWVPVWLWVAYRKPARDTLDFREPDAATTHVARRAVLANTHVLRALIALAAAGPVGAFADAWEAKFYADQLHVPDMMRGAYLIVGPICYDLGILAFAEMGTRLGSRRIPFAIAASLASGGFIAVSFARTPVVAATCLGLHAAGRGGLMALLLAEMVASIPKRIVSTASGVIAGARGLVAAIVTPLIGYSLAHIGYSGVLLVLGAWTLPGSLVWLLWRPKNIVALT
jgi:ACS family hexuronate transporter-like MFS transporter